MLTETRFFREKGWKLRCFSRQPLVKALKGYGKASGIFLMGIEKPLGNAQIPAASQ
jgi:hypothetical protein